MNTMKEKIKEAGRVIGEINTILGAETSFPAQYMTLFAKVDGKNEPVIDIHLVFQDGSENR